MSLDIHEFKHLQLRRERNTKNNEFSILINNFQNKNIEITSNKKTNNIITKYSTINAIKPFIFFSSICANRMFSYTKNGIMTIGKLSKIYNIVFFLFIIIIMILLKPKSWTYTESDIPLNIITKTFGFCHIFELLFILIDNKFFNSENYVLFFVAIENIDNHLKIMNKTIFQRVRLFSIFIACLPVLEYVYSRILGGFQVNNIGVQITFLLFMSQGATIGLMVILFYVRVLIFSILLRKKCMKHMPRLKDDIIEDHLSKFTLKVGK